MGTGRFWLLILAGWFPIQSLAQWHPKAFYLTGYAQGTTYHITYYAKDSLVTKQHITTIFDNIDSSLSIYKPYSLISQFNSTDSGVEVDEHLRIVVNKSLEIFKETEGISDITVYPLVRAWGFGTRHMSVLPDSSDIQAIMPCIGAQKIHLNQNQLAKDIPCIQIDVNGIAQGYSVDVIADFLERKGIDNYLVEVGGELRVKGRKQPDRKRMKIGIESPANNSDEEPVIQTTIELDQGAVTTSGNYRKYYQKGNRTISHLINPKTGFSFQNELISVTMVAKKAITADGYDNALMGMGLKKALIFMKRHKEMSAYFIYRKPDGSVADTATAGFNKLIKKDSSATDE